MPTKPRSHITEPTSIKVPGSTSGIITIIDTEGRHHVECDLCHSDITLTVTAHPCFFYDHWGHAGCLYAQRRQGLPDPIACSLAAPPIPYIMVTPSPAQSSGLECIQCPGLDVTWTPGSIWETYSYHQHHIRAVGWKPVRFGEEENVIFLQSDKCHQTVLDTDEPPCIECRLIINSANYSHVMEHAKEAKDHTPWNLLTAEQSHALLQKMANTIKMLRKKVRGWTLQSSWGRCNSLLNPNFN